MFVKKDEQVELFDVKPKNYSLAGEIERTYEDRRHEANKQFVRQRDFRETISTIVWKVSETLLFLVIGTSIIFYPRLGLLTLIRNILQEYFPTGQYHELESLTLYLFAILCIYIHTNTIKRHIELILCERKCIEMGITDFLYTKLESASREADRTLLRQKWFNYVGRTVADRLKDSLLGLSLYFLIIFNVTIFFCLLVVLAIPIVRIVYRKI